MKFEQFSQPPKEQNVEEKKREAPKTEAEIKAEQEKRLEEEVMQELDKIIESQDEKIRPILSKNLELMTGTARKQMIGFVARESIGGNAGRYENLPCVGANFYYDKNMGEISEFSNNITENKDLAQGTFRLVVLPSYYKIIDKFLSHREDAKFNQEGTEEAKKIIEQSADLYNQKNIIKQEKIISKINNINELLQNLEKIGVIEGSNNHFYSPKELKNIIDEVSKNKSELRKITRTAGLRDKVAELLDIHEEIS